MDKQPAPPLPPWLSTMVPFERYVVPVAGQHLHVMEVGSGRPVFMVHGNPTWGFLYRKVAQILAHRGFRCIMPDLVGLGFSSRPRDAAWHSIDNHATAMGALVDALDLDDLVLMVQDWGGPIGTRMILERPQRLGGMVVLNTVVGTPRPGFRPSMFHRVAQTPVLSDVLFRGLGLPQSALWLAQGERRSISGRVARAYRLPLRHWADRRTPLVLARMVPDSHAHPSIPALQRCEAFCRAYAGPTSVVWGEKDPVLGRALKRVMEILPNAEVTRTTAGHFLQEEVPEIIADATVAVHARRHAA